MHKPNEMSEARWYVNMNHLFQSIPGDSTGAEYAKASPVAKVVIEDIASWIKARIGMQKAP